VSEKPSWLDSLRGLVRFAAPSVGNVFELADIYAHKAPWHEGSRRIDTSGKTSGMSHSSSEISTSYSS
jgi:hypothetical protein